MTIIDTAIILAGGKSTRMGLDKQFLRLENRFIVDLIIEQLEPAFKEIIIVTNRADAYKDSAYTVVEDEIKDFGPIGGIHAGLKKSKSLFNYVVACDMPYINMAFIRHMKRVIEQCGEPVDAVITKYGEWIEPLNAFYGQTFVSRIEEAVTKGERRISKLLEKAQTQYIEEAVAREFSPNWEMFMNLNTFKDYQNYVKINYRGIHHEACRKTMD